MDQAMDWEIATIVAVVPIAAVIGGLVIAALSLQSRARLKMAAHQERLAMIKRGQTPPAEERAFPGLPPGSWDDMTKSTQRDKDDPTRRRDNAVWMVGFGAAATLLFCVGFDEPELAMGIGGAFGILSLTYFITSFVTRPESASRPGPEPGHSEPAGTDYRDINS